MIEPNWKKKSEIKPPLAVHTTIAWVDDIYMFKRNLARGRIACFKGLAEKRFDFPPENRSRAAVTCHTKEPTSVLLKNYSNLPNKRTFLQQHRCGFFCLTCDCCSTPVSSAKIKSFFSKAPENRSRTAVTWYTKEPTSVLLSVNFSYSNNSLSIRELALTFYSKK